jgi:phage terminase small subunit
MAVKRLTIREAKFFKELASGKTLGDAAIAAGYSPKHARQSGFQALEVIKSKMPDIMEKKGLTGEALIDKYLLPALSAEETEFAKFEGKITDQQNVVAWGPRLTALDMAFNLRGDYAAKEITGKGGAPVAIQVVTNVQLPHE